MKNETWEISYQILSADELTSQQSQTLHSARKAVETAYSPYSNYQVGAAILMANGDIVQGNNQENAVYPLGLCAERVALFSMGVRYPETKPILMALTIASPNKPGFPCGSCRQSMVEFSHRYQCDLPLLIESTNDTFIYFEDARSLLPFTFDHMNLFV